jgi:hypothetical protein
MLPNNLRKLKQLLDGIGYSYRTDEEEKILQILNNMEIEFEQISNLFRESDNIKNSINEGNLVTLSMTGGSLGNCPCCGAKL